MNNLTPRQIGDDESDNRGVKAGWYAIRRNGPIRLGPFSSREKRLTEIALAEPEPAPRANWSGDR